MCIVMDCDDRPKHKNGLARYFSKFHSRWGRTLKDFVALHNTVLKQRKQLRIVSEKIVHCIKCMDRCIFIKGLIIPMNEIRALITSYNSNIQKLKCYETKALTWRLRVKRMLFWNLNLLAIASFVHAFTGGAFWFHYGFSPVIYKVLFRDTYQLYVTEYMLKERVFNYSTHYIDYRMVEENNSISPSTSAALPMAIRPSYDSFFRVNIAIMALFCAIFIIVVLSFPILVAISVVVHKTFKKTPDIATIEREYAMHKKFFDLLHTKKHDNRDSVLDMAKKEGSFVHMNRQASTRMLTRELWKKLAPDHPEKHIIYDRDIFRYDPQVSRLLMRLKEWVRPIT